MLPVSPADASSLVVPAWAFARGNALIHASPDPFADAAPTPISPPSDPATGSSIGLHPKSKFLAITDLAEKHTSGSLLPHINDASCI